MSKPNPNYRKLTPEERFWSKVCFGDGEGCWTWTASKNSGGYGQFRMNGTNNLAHRVAYVWQFGEIPEGLPLDHLCRNRPCVNPWHAEPVTTMVNFHRSHHPHANAVRPTRLCHKGHLMTEGNLRIASPGRERCLTCYQEYMRVYLKAYRPGWDRRRGRLTWEEWRQRQEERRWKPCPVCGASFRSNGSSARTCGRLCGSKLAWAARRRREAGVLA